MTTGYAMGAQQHGPLAHVDALLGQLVSMRALAILRIAAGPIVLIHLWPFLADAATGQIYRDSFYEPYAAWYPELGRSAYEGLLWAGAVAAVAMSVGLFTRVTTATTFAVVAYNVFLSTTHFHNNRAYLIVVLAALALVPCGRELSIDARLRKRRSLPRLDPRAPGWPLWLLRFEASVVYGASGLSKLLDPDWFGGTVTWQRVLHGREQLVASPLPGWAIELLGERTLHVYAAKAIVLTELFIAAGLWFRRSRYAAVWVAVCFHVAIEVSAQVQIFSMLAIAVLVIWAVPSTRDRTLVVDPASAAHRRFAAIVRRLDWLARFTVERGTTGSPIRIVDRDGSCRTGRPAVIFALSRLPVTAWFTLPALLLSSRVTDRQH